MGEVGGAVRKRMGISQGGGNVLQGVGTGSTTFWIVYLGTFSVMERKVEGTHMVFMTQITGKWARQKSDWMWVTPSAEVVQEAAGTQSEMT